MTVIRPRRSCLYMPGANARALEKAKSLAADTLIFDLEDAVAPDAKVSARETIQSALAQGGYGQREIVIRINGLDTEWGQADLAAAIAAGPDAILVPKVMTAEDILTIDAAMTSAGAPDDMGLWVMIEMPKAIFNLSAIADTAATTRLTTFVMGTNDLAKEMRAINDPPFRTAFQTALSLSIAAARSAGIIAIDGVFNDIGDGDGLQAECHQGRLLGFDGKTLIHPSQLAVANVVFAPAGEDVTQAKAIIEAFSDPANAGKGVLKVNGKMTELLHLDEARRIVAVAEAIAVFEAG
ncbi:MAG: HpcH/HpaI aldolase/citrate lyase family protein [Henriciella sp.]